MMHLRSFNLDLVFVGDFETLKYIYNHPDCQGRANNIFKESFKEDRMIKGKDFPGVIMSEGKVWEDQRRFTLRALRDFGFGKTGMEEMILEEVQLFKTLINKNEGEPFDFINQYNLPILNALWRVTVGERFDYDNPKLISIIERLTKMFKRIAKPENVITVCFPWIFKLFPTLLEKDKSIETNHDIMNLMLESIKQHQDTLDPNEPRDFTDKVLVKIQQTTDETSSFYGETGIENLANTLFDLFVAGSETTSTTLTWAALYMIRYPEIQKKVQRELDEMVGTDTPPSMKDRHKLPYTEAVIMEIQRCANIIPNGLQHLCHRDFMVNGLTIPADTLIQPVFIEILKGDHWKDGMTFRPERFLDQEGNLKRDEHLIPFSMGKRQCLGETLAKTEIFIFFTSLIHQYHFLPEVEGEYPSENYSPGLTILPVPFKTRLVSRI
eukprot:GFUD01079879.1.p1 GENE.GFUD01079879.1~~GFUD01079879.1.p1  ORF type:complete len:438 (-),score=100.01 GFUD01079879.1:38-1351(-)